MATKMQMKTIMMSPAVTGILEPVKVTAVRMPVAICMAAMMLPHTRNRILRPCLHSVVADTHETMCSAEEPAVSCEVVHQCTAGLYMLCLAAFKTLPVLAGLQALHEGSQQALFGCSTCPRCRWRQRWRPC